MSEPSRVAVVDADADYRLLVRLALEADDRLLVVAESNSLDDAVMATAASSPSVFLLSAGLISAGLEADLGRLIAAAPHSAVVTTSAIRLAEQVEARNWVGHLSKAVPPSQLPAEILRLTEPLVDPEITSAGLQLRAKPESAGLARRFIESTLAEWGCEALVDSARLVVSELASNAVGHGRASFDLRVILLPDRLCVEVTDDSDERLHRRRSEDYDISGRGIAIVENLADSWGVKDRPVGKTVWFELAR